MPEGPEAKIASDYLNHFLNKKKKTHFTLLTDYYVKNYSEVFEILNHNLKNNETSFTHGKNIFVKLKKKLIFNIHLGMTGGWSNDLIKHCHFKISNNNKVLYFKDVRKFAKMRILNTKDFHQKYDLKLDVFNPDYSIKYHYNYLLKNVKQKAVCKILMNQNYFPGVGNYIKSEVLYILKIHPEQDWSKLSSLMKKKLISTTKSVIHNSYQKGGAELKDFNNPFFKSKFKLKAYGNKSNDITSILTSDNRKTWYNPKIQQLIN